MKKHFYSAAIFSLFLLFFVANSFTTGGYKNTPYYYQLTVYHCKNAEQLNITGDYLKNIYLPELHKMGMKNIGVFSAIDNDTATNKNLFILIPFLSFKKLEAFEDKTINGIFLSNEASAYVNAAFNNAPYERIETTILKAFAGMPHLKTPSLTSPFSERVYELRSYEAATEKLYRQKVKMFNEAGEIDLFNRLQFNAVFYAEVLSGSHMPNLVYMTTFNNRAERDAHWKNFANDSTWKRISALPEYKNTVSKADIFFLRPTEYSDY